MLKKVLLILFALTISEFCFCQQNAIDHDSLTIDTIGIAKKSDSLQIITLGGNFNDSLILSYDNKILFAKQCKTDESDGITASPAAIIQPFSNKKLELVCYSEKIKRVITPLPGYPFLYIFKIGRIIKFEFSSRQLEFD